MVKAEVTQRPVTALCTPMDDARQSFRSSTDMWLPDKGQLRPITRSSLNSATRVRGSPTGLMRDTVTPAPSTVPGGGDWPSKAILSRPGAR